jgi:hypothetical protein
LEFALSVFKITLHGAVFLYLTMQHARVFGLAWDRENEGALNMDKELYKELEAIELRLWELAGKARFLTGQHRTEAEGYISNAAQELPWPMTGRGTHQVLDGKLPLRLVVLVLR